MNVHVEVLPRDSRSEVGWELRQVLEELRAESGDFEPRRLCFYRKNGQPIASIRRAPGKGEARSCHSARPKLFLVDQVWRLENKVKKLEGSPLVKIKNSNEILVRKLFPSCSQTKSVENQSAASY
jgi:hypothetical protein